MKKHESRCDLFALICSDLDIKEDKCMTLVQILSLCSQFWYSSKQRTIENLRIKTQSFHRSSWCWSHMQTVTLTLSIWSKHWLHTACVQSSLTMHMSVLPPWLSRTIFLCLINCVHDDALSWAAPVCLFKGFAVWSCLYIWFCRDNASYCL